MDLGLTGRRALVLASSRGLGLGIATALAEGADVVITGRSADKLAAAAAKLTQGGPGRAHAIAGDFAAEGAVQALADAALDRLGGVDILVNNTGGPPPGSVLDATPAVWEAQFAVMVRNVFDITARLVPAMRRAASAACPPSPRPASSSRSPASASPTRSARRSSAGRRRSPTRSPPTAPPPMCCFPAASRPTASIEIDRANRGEERQDGRGGGGGGAGLDPRRALWQRRGVRRGRRLPGERARRLCHRQPRCAATAA